MAQTLDISPADISLFHVAARVWSDATAWLALARANPDTFISGGAIDPMIYGLATISVPDWDASFSGSAPS
jgi:hypothetical protein